MAFDFGWDYRANGVTGDPSYAKPAKDDTLYPTTFTNGDGFSINAGWDANMSGASGGPVGSNDPRITGSVYKNATGTWTVDLSSGSAPGAGNYAIDIALGYQGAGRPAENAVVKDNTTTVLDLTNGGTGYATNQDQYVDATGSLITATTTWTGTPVVKTFASTTVNLVLNSINDGNNEMLAHFRLTLQEGGASLPIPVAMAHYRQRGN